MRKTNSGILLINKPAMYTSRHIGNMLSKKFGIKKVGHLGTLDPFATGLLIFALNEGTKVLPYIEDQSKTYIATFHLGYLTSTLDPEGEVLSNEQVEEFPLTKIKEVLNSFLGEITQIPPLTSAIKVDGKRLYEYAHKGEVVDVPERKVFIHELNLVEYLHPFLKVEATVSKGTYIRTLGEDIARLLGTHAATVFLERTRHGKFLLQDAQTLEEAGLEHIVPPSKVLEHIPSFQVSPQTIIDVRNGKDIIIDADDEVIQIHDENGTLHALCRKNGEFYTPTRGFNL